MPKFIYTYGTEGQPFRGGWSEVIAPDRRMADQLFTLIHPCKHGDLLNCCSIYTEEQFQRTQMYLHGNFGVRCHETIKLSVTTFNERSSG